MLSRVRLFAIPWTVACQVSLPLNLEEKKRYDREFLLGFQFIFASMQKPEGLPHISDVVLDKVGRPERESKFMLVG